MRIALPQDSALQSGDMYFLAAVHLDMQSSMTQEVLLLCSCFTSPITRAARFAELAWGDRQAPLLELPTLKEAHLGWLQGMRQGNASLQLFAHLRHPLCSAAVLCLAFLRFQATTQALPPENGAHSRPIAGYV